MSEEINKIKDDLAALKIDFTKLETTIKNYSKFGVLAITALAAWLGYTNIETIPKTAKDVVFEKLGKDVSETIKNSINVAKEGEEKISKILSELKLKPITLYQCPMTTGESKNAEWVSFGCNGQISSNSTCEIRYYNHPIQVKECSPITMYQNEK